MATQQSEAGERENHNTKTRLSRLTETPTKEGDRKEKKMEAELKKREKGEKNVREKSKGLALKHA